MWHGMEDKPAQGHSDFQCPNVHRQDLASLVAETQGNIMTNVHPDYICSRFLAELTEAELWWDGVSWLAYLVHVVGVLVASGQLLRLGL